MPMETFVQVFTEIAQVNLPQFEAVEKLYGIKARESEREARLEAEFAARDPNQQGDEKDGKVETLPSRKESLK